MLFSRRIAVVVPAHNESRFIASALEGIPGFVDLVAVIDDGSTDGTADVARGTGDPRVVVVRHPSNRGVGAAIATGYREVFARGADVAAVMAGDAQMDPADLERVVSPVARGEADYCKGDRLSHPSVLAAMPWPRWVANHVFTLLTRVATGLPVTDSQCGYTAISRQAAERIGLRYLWPRYGYPNDLLGHVAAANLRVHEVTVRPIYAGEESGIRWQDGLLVVPFVIARVAARRWQIS